VNKNKVWFIFKYCSYQRVKGINIRVIRHLARADLNIAESLIVFKNNFFIGIYCTAAAAALQIDGKSRSLLLMLLKV
jgi:hypothetical protein